MLSKTRNTILYFVLLSILFSSQIFAKDVTRQEAQLRKTLLPLGNDVVGEYLPGIVINDPYKYIAGRPGKYIYQVFSKDNKNTNTKYELRSKIDSKVEELKKWTLKIDNDSIEEWEADSKGSIHLIAQTDIDSGYRVEFTTHLLLPAGAQQGEQWKTESSLNVYEISDPDTIAYQGELLSTKTYEGRFKIVTPAGEFDTILISDDYEINIGSVNIKDRRYTFYASNVGKVAEIDGVHVSAFLFYHKRQNEVKVLMAQPPAIDK